MRFGLWKPVLLGCVATPILLFVGFLSCGVGHGNCVFLFLLFPYAVLVAKLIRGAALLTFVIALIQFPAYGLVLGLIGQTGLKWTWAAISLLGFHTVMIALAFVFG